MKRTIDKTIIILVIVCLLATTLLSACGSNGPEYRTYHKVYKDSNGNWQGRDVTYDAHVDGSPLLILVVIVVVGLLVAKAGKK